MTEKDIIEEIKKYDPNFSKVEFKRWCGDVLKTLQEAWSKKDLATLKYHEAKELYQLHENQLKVMQERKIVNITKDMEIGKIEITDYNRMPDCEIFKVIISVSLIDYYQKENSMQILSGYLNQKVNADYKLEIARDKDFLTEWLVDKSITVCPNCGATINMLQQKKCEYCETEFITMDNSYKIKALEI